MKRKPNLEKLQKLVLRNYPQSKVIKVSDKYTVVDSDGNDILFELLLPHGPTEENAWQLAATTCKVIQNFNRTHPDRATFDLSEEKSARSKRRSM
jgi:hypothetical protein